jgi:carbamoyl-phosphate synthase large subunit
MTKVESMKGGMNILFTCIGRRVSLLESFRRAARALKVRAVFIGTDTSRLSSALHLCDREFVVKPIRDPRYLPELLKIVKQNGVRLLIPTIDTDLLVLTENKDKFARLGCMVLVSPPEVIRICQDKRKTYRFLTNHAFDTPVTVRVGTALTKKKLAWPCFLKPWDGYASRGNAVVNNRRELSFFAERIPNPICQEFVTGLEHTCDVYVDFDMKVRCVVPRRRIEVRAGEVSKGQVVKDPAICTEAARLVQALGAGPGVITLQLFLTEQGKIKFIEINPRFGGGVPLSIKAGADFPKWILQELLGRKPRIRLYGYKDGLTMLRYDAEVWLEPSKTKNAAK